MAGYGGSWSKLFSKQLWRRVQPLNPAGVNRRGNIIMVVEADANSDAYLRVLSELYLVEGLH